MSDEDGEHTLEFLLAFDGRTHWYEGGYHVRFEIKRVRKTKARPHGLKYAFTLHDPKGNRILGFDNAHAVKPQGSKFKAKAEAADHWHRTANDKGRPYQFTDAATLVEDLFNEVERELTERDVKVAVVAESDERKE